MGDDYVILETRGYRERLKRHVAFQSGTLKLILTASTEFAEKGGPIVRLPTLSPSTLRQICAYLEESSAVGGAGGVGFVPEMSTVSFLLMNGLYLDLPGLVDICCDYISNNFDYVDMFGDLPSEIIRNILGRLNPFSLKRAEVILKEELSKSSYRKLGWESIWKDKFKVYHSKDNGYYELQMKSVWKSKTKGNPVNLKKACIERELLKIIKRANISQSHDFIRKAIHLLAPSCSSLLLNGCGVDKSLLQSLWNNLPEDLQLINLSHGGFSGEVIDSLLHTMAAKKVKISLLDLSSCKLEEPVLWGLISGLRYKFEEMKSEINVMDKNLQGVENLAVVSLSSHELDRTSNRTKVASRKSKRLTFKKELDPGHTSLPDIRNGMRNTGKLPLLKSASAGAVAKHIPMKNVVDMSISVRQKTSLEKASSTARFVSRRGLEEKLGGDSIKASSSESEKGTVVKHTSKKGVHPKLEYANITGHKVTKINKVKKKVKHLNDFEKQNENKFSSKKKVSNVSSTNQRREKDVLKSNAKEGNVFMEMILRGNSLTGCAESLCHVLQMGRTLKYLNISFNNLGESGSLCVSQLLKCQNCTLKGINLRGTGLGKAGLENIAECLMKNNTLELIDISENLPECNGTDPGISLGKALEINCTVKEFYASKNNFSTSGIFSLTDCLKKNKNLETIDLSEVDFGAAGSRNLALKLKDNTSLKELNLFCNNIPSRGCIDIAAFLSCNSTVTKLNLGCNAISTAVAESFAAILSKNCFLTHLTLDGNECGPFMKSEGCTMMAKSLMINTSLQYLSLNGQQIGNKGATAFAKALPKSHLKYLGAKNCNIGAKGSTALIDCFQSFPWSSSSFTLNLIDNPIPDENVAVLKGMKRSGLAITVSTNQCTVFSYEEHADAVHSEVKMENPGTYNSYLPKVCLTTCGGS